jgi:hypothetical protein
MKLIVEAAMISYENKKIDLMRKYESRFPFDVESARRAWRVSFMFDRMELFERAVLLALSHQDVADWSEIFNISYDVDFSSISEHRRVWPDPSYLRPLGCK